MRHLSDDLAARIIVSNPQDSTKESKCRELISPVLVAAALLAAALLALQVKVDAEMNINGIQASGSIDWAMLYKAMCIVVVEAKLFPKWDDYMGQVAAEIVATREEFALTKLGKRKRDMDEAMAQVPSWAILTNGLNYKFVKFMPTTNQAGTTTKQLLGSTTMTVPLTPGMTAQQVFDHVKPVVARIMYVIEQQCKAVDRMWAA